VKQGKTARKNNRQPRKQICVLKIHQVYIIRANSTQTENIALCAHRIRLWNRKNKIISLEKWIKFVELSNSV